MTLNLLRIPYREAMVRQRDMVARRIAGDVPDLIWYLEHPPVVTWSRARGRQHLRASPEELARAGVALEETDRGGDVTYHAPGQLVGYPIVALGAGREEERDLHRYLRLLEDALMDLLAGLSVRAHPVPGRTGVWVAHAGTADGGRGCAKIAALGVRVRRWVTGHGFALNISCDLRPFRDLIVPCGLSDARVTSLHEVLRDVQKEVQEVEEGTRDPAPTAEALLWPLHQALQKRLERPLGVTLDGENVFPADKLRLTSGQPVVPWIDPTSSP